MSLSKFTNYCRVGLMRINLTGSNGKFFHRFNGSEIDSLEELILKNTVITTRHLTPELKLRLITSECELWHSKATESKFPSDPFWGIYWPGGQALGRYILDNKDVVQEKNVLDIGSGCGACAVAAVKSGAALVLANDIDGVSINAININAKLNNVKLYTSKSNLIGKNIDDIVISNENNKKISKWDVILVGDMFYDSEFSLKLFHWLTELVKEEKIVLIGDPGRYALKDLKKMSDIGKIIKITEYEFENIEHNGYPNAAIYMVRV